MQALEEISMNYLTTSLFAVALTSVSAGFSPLVLADPSSEYEKHRDEHHKEQGDHNGKENCKYYAAGWMAGLTAEQSQKVDKLKEDFHKKKHVIKDKIKDARIELSKATIQDEPKQNDIYSKIDKILKLKGEKMRLTAAHKIQVRKMLTVEQRVKFDEHVLKKGAYCNHRKGLR